MKATISDNIDFIAAILLLISLVNTSGCKKDAPEQTSRSPPPSAEPIFENHADEAGLSFVHHSGHTRKCYIPEIVAGGAALFDLESDGDLDVYFIQSGDIQLPSEQRPPNKLFRNRGDGTFEDITEMSNTGDRGYGMGVATGDYNNDTRTDLYITNVGPNVLLRNNGDATFTDVTAQAGVGHDGFGASAAFVDYDADGDLDLFFCNYLNWSLATSRTCRAASGEFDYCSPSSYKAPARDVLYRNNGDSTFTDVSNELGIADEFGTGLGVATGDFTGNGRLDIFVANDAMMNHLWVLGEDGRFHNRALQMGCALDEAGRIKAGMGVGAADIDDDADLDLLVVNLQNETDSLFRNQGQYFRDDTAATALTRASRAFTRFGTGFVDLNNDTYLDLYQANGRVRRQNKRYADDPYAEPNLVLMGSPAGRYEPLMPRGGVEPSLIHTSRGAAFGDINNDGGVDVLVINRDAKPYLLQNVDQKRGNWLTLRVLDEHGRNALNAKVTVQLEDRTIRRDVLSAYSYCTANDPRVHFGLGEATQVEQVTVKFVDGTIQTYGPRDTGQMVTIRRGQSDAG